MAYNTPGYILTDFWIKSYDAPKFWTLKGVIFEWGLFQNSELVTFLGYSLKSPGILQKLFTVLALGRLYSGGYCRVKVNSYIHKNEKILRKFFLRIICWIIPFLLNVSNDKYFVYYRILKNRSPPEIEAPLSGRLKK